jgi:hypothetical protein
MGWVNAVTIKDGKMDTLKATAKGRDGELATKHDTADCCGIVRQDLQSVREWHIMMQWLPTFIARA